MADETKTDPKPEPTPEASAAAEQLVAAMERVKALEAEKAASDAKTAEAEKVLEAYNRQLATLKATNPREADRVIAALSGNPQSDETRVSGQEATRSGRVAEDASDLSPESLRLLEMAEARAEARFKTREAESGKRIERLESQLFQREIDDQAANARREVGDAVFDKIRPELNRAIASNPSLVRAGLVHVARSLAIPYIKEQAKQELLAEQKASADKLAANRGFGASPLGSRNPADIEKMPTRDVIAAAFAQEGLDPNDIGAALRQMQTGSARPA